MDENVSGVNQPAATSKPAPPIVLEVRPRDIGEILGAGLSDFRAAPLYGVGISAIYTVGGWCLVFMLVVLDLPFLVYPLAAGFAFVAPFIATTFYATSHRLERGETMSWGRLFSSVRNATRRDLGWMALVTGFALYIWVDIAAILFFSFLGLRSWEFQELMQVIFTTPIGLLFLLIGNVAGAFLAVVVFSISVTSFPMLFHRDVDFVTAMTTSVKVVFANPVTMLLWCIIIAVLTGLSILSGLIGLLVVLPVLGHASWHLYRRAVAPAEGA